MLCCLKDTWMHPFPLAAAKLAPYLDSWHHLWSENDAISLWLRLISTSDYFIRLYKTYTKCLSHCYTVSRAYGCTLTPSHRPSCPQNWEFWFTCGVKMMSLRHIWGWYLPQTTSYIHIGHIKSVWAINMMSQWHMGAPSCSCRYSSQVGPRFGKRASLVEREWCHSVMVETNIQLILLHTFILDIYKVLAPLLCCLKDIWVHPYTIPSAKLSPELGILVHLGSKTDVINLCLRLNPPQTTVYIHIRHTQSV